MFRRAPAFAQRPAQWPGGLRLLRPASKLAEDSTICGRAPAFADGLRHFPRASAFAEGNSVARHLRGAVWRVGICRVALVFAEPVWHLLTAFGICGARFGSSAYANGLRHLPEAIWPLPICRGLSAFADVGSHRGIWGRAPAYGDGLPHLPKGFSICRRLSPFGDGLPHLGTGFGTCRAALAPADGLRHLPGAFWQFPICRGRLAAPHLPRAFAICRGRSSAWTFVRVRSSLGHLSAEIFGSDKCPRGFRARTFVRGRPAHGYLSAGVRGGCPDEPVGACLVRARYFRKPLRMKDLQKIVRGWSGVGQGMVRGRSGQAFP
jgi:hypothetical protein